VDHLSNPGKKPSKVTEEEADISYTIEFSVKQHCLHPLFQPLSPLLPSPLPSFTGIHKVRKFY
jgi:hypothetical protein